ncbi:Mating factor alpha [Wickerhamomyces ciferrii]|uniref:Mating factor alpha n=1 Tax=Wickerhamomyces ciferrii (strain ATCC 14091 / BCRC 22168 / CBS 111 / JCM 3599 / NBRC 0793 / NRRL Y-1031 F-60-10) TaxID=1206466 RepID=K0KH35_WICCF|nr:Mating factor alpha [Wickerhamomyces ciferrii]CCH44525.1 Mating factor alpha [Wickerhamomyces ciferrii]
MQLSLLTSLAIVSTLLGSSFAAPVENINIKDNGNGTSEADVPGTSQGVEFPFAKEAIIEAVSLGNDIAPIVLNDAVYFVNTTTVDKELESKLGKREAWNWRVYLNGSPNYKREAEADAEPWRWSRPIVSPCGPRYKRDADAEPHRWTRPAYCSERPKY